MGLLLVFSSLGFLFLFAGSLFAYRAGSTKNTLACIPAIICTIFGLTIFLFVALVFSPAELGNNKVSDGGAVNISRYLDLLTPYEVMGSVPRGAEKIIVIRAEETGETFAIPVTPTMEIPRRFILMDRNTMMETSPLRAVPDS